VLQIRDLHGLHSKAWLESKTPGQVLPKNAPPSLWGYTYILGIIVPKMRVKGMTEEQLNMIMIENPIQLLCFV
jgi:predicted metal-dependent phosphotriesterase family hydrolase